MNDEMYKALSKGYIADLLQVNALELIETQQNSIMHRNDLLAELARNVEELQAEVARLKAAHGNLWSALADVMEQPGDHPNATVRRMAACAEKALVHDTIAEVHPVPRFYKIKVKI